MFDKLPLQRIVPQENSVVQIVGCVQYVLVEAGEVLNMMIVSHAQKIQQHTKICVQKHKETVKLVCIIILN